MCSFNYNCCTNYLHFIIFFFSRNYHHLNRWCGVFLEQMFASFFLVANLEHEILSIIFTYIIHYISTNRHIHLIIFRICLIYTVLYLDFSFTIWAKKKWVTFVCNSIWAEFQCMLQNNVHCQVAKSKTIYWKIRFLAFSFWLKKTILYWFKNYSKIQSLHSR